MVLNANDEPVDLSSEVSKLMEAHDIPFHREDEWLVPYGELPAIRANWYPGDSSGRLDVEILVSKDEVICECFAGFGSGAEGIANGIENFCINSYHVLLAAFWGQNDQEQVTTESWDVGSASYTAYIGNFGTRASAGAEPIVPKGLLESIESAIKHERLVNETHWARHFFANINGEHTFESLLDNEPWEAGLNSFRSLPWAKPETYYSVRSFVVLKKNVSRSRWNLWNRIKTSAPLN